MANITLSVPDWLHKLMKRYKSVNWSEVARRAIIKEILSLKAREEGLTREELEVLIEISGIEFPSGLAPRISEDELLKRMRERERRRIERLKEVGP
ncbi:MAG: hypothetical protein QI197_04805 [Candidatus Korarchaeota archaeon]|nr:hypothetical protein [Candidatus Korarchaeota archaeon]